MSDSGSDVSSAKDDEVASQRIESENDDSGSERENDEDDNDAKSEQSGAERGSQKDAASQGDKGSVTGSRKSRTESVRSYEPYIPYQPPEFGLVDGDYGASYAKNFDIICVHGVHGKRDWTWVNEDGYGSDWIKLTLFQYWSLRQLTFWYDVDRDIYRQGGIEKLAMNLLDDLVDSRKNFTESDKHRPIVFMAHDVGGSIVKMALILAALNPSKYGQIPFLTSTLIFMGCPHRSISSEVLEDQLVTLLVMDPETPNSGVVRKAKQLATSIQRINADFLDTKMLIRAGIFNIYPVLKDPTKDPDKNEEKDKTPADRSATPDPADEQPKPAHVIPFDKFTSTFNSPFEFNVWTTRTHRDLVRGEKGSDVGTWPETVRRVLNLVPYYMDIDTRIMELSRLILSQCPPLYPFQIPHNTENPFYKGFNEHESTKKWLAGRGLCLLHAYGKADITETSQRIFQALDSTLPLKDSRFSVMYFQFDRHDHRFNNIKAMLCSFLSVLVSRYAFELEDNIARAFEFLAVHDAWSLQDLYQVFDWLRDSTSTEQLTYVVSCLDQCDESRDWFISELLKIGEITESRYKWVITSSDPKIFKDALPDAWSIDLDELAASLPPPGHESDSEDSSSETSEHVGEDAEAEKKSVTDAQKKPATDADPSKPSTNDDGGPVPEVEKEIITKGDAAKPGDEEADGKSLAGETSAIHISVEPKKDEVGDAEVDAHEENGSEPKDALHERLESSLATLLDNRPVTTKFAPELRALLAQCGSDVELGCIMLAWIDHKTRNAAKTTVQRLVERLQQPTPDGVFKIMLGDVEAETRDKVQRLVTWLRYSVRPLSVYEIATAVNFDETSEAGLRLTDLLDAVNEILPAFGGFFELVRNELCAGHPHFQRRNTDDVESFAAHADIAKACLRYLSLPNVQEQIGHLSDNLNMVDESPHLASFHPRYNLISYAVMHWPAHYRLAGPQAPAEDAFIFFQGRETATFWHDAFYTLTNPMNRIDKGYQSPLPAVAITGLSDLAAGQLEKERLSKSFAADCDLAIVEAATYGHAEVVGMLIKASEPGREALKKAIKAAASYGVGSALDDLVEHAAKIDGFEWPEFLLCRIAFLGLAPLAQKLIDCHVELEPKDPEQGMSPLHVAARARHEGVAKVLVDAKASLTFQADFENFPLHTAAQAGHPGIVKMLIEAGAELEVKNNEKVTPTLGAADWARPKALQVLLEAGGEYEYGDTEGEEEAASARKPLVHASQNDYIQCVKLLLAKGADANATSGNGNALYVAADAGNLEVSRLLIEHGAKPDSSDKRELLLLRAVSSGNLEIVKLLLDNGVDIEEESKFDTYRSTALSRAAGNGSKEMVDLLLERKADPKHYGEGSQPPVYAATYGHIDIVQKLLEAGADANATVSDTQWSAVHASYDNPDIMRLLLENGGDVERPCDGGTPLYLAARWDYAETIKVLLEHDPKPDLEAEMHKEGDEEDGMTPLCIACRQGNPEVMRLLLDEGADPNHRTKDGSFPLEFCAQSWNTKSEEVARLLLEYRPRLDLADDEGNTVLHSFGRYTPFAVVKMLINAGADLDAANKLGFSSLCIAIEQDYAEVALFLLKKKAQPNIFGPTFGSPLHIACNLGMLDIAKALVKAGADVNHTSPEFTNSTLYSACSTKYTPDRVELLKYLVEEVKVSVNVYGGPLGYPVTRASLHGDPDCLKYLLEKDADPDVEDEVGRRPIHLASYRTMENVQALLEKGAMTNVRDKLGRTPLHYVVLSGSTALIEKMLDVIDGPIDVPDNDDWTPLMWACRISNYWQTTSYYQFDVIKLLIDRGANIWARGKGWDRDWSPLKLARFYRAGQVVEELLTPQDKERMNENGKKETWDAKFHESRPGNLKYHELCDGCIFEITGAFWKCLGCQRRYTLCFKCYKSRDILHPGHDFQEIGPEYDEVVEEEKGSSTGEPGDATPAGENGGAESDSDSSVDGKIKSRTKKYGSDSDSNMGVEDEESEEDDDGEEDSTDAESNA